MARGSSHRYICQHLVPSISGKSSNSHSTCPGSSDSPPLSVTVSTVLKNKDSVTKTPKPPKGPQRLGRITMDESYETFEEDLGPQRVDYPPPKPIRPIRRPEMYATRKTKEEMASGPQQIKAEPKILPREPSFNRSSSIQQSVSTQTEVPLESVTLNRCLFIVITILVLTSGFQRLHEALHGHGVAFGEEENEFGLAVRRSGALRHRTKPETSLWEVVLSWLPDLDDDDEDDDDKDVEIKKRKPKLRTAAKSPSSLRNKQLPGKKLLKQRDCKIKGRQGKKSLQDEIQEEEQEFLEEADNEHEEEENEEKELISSVEKRKKLSKG